MISLICLIFSKDRAMQLQAAIESFFLHCKDNVEICVLYEATNPTHRGQYGYLQNKFRNINFQEEYNFKVQVLADVSQFSYVLFVCDDVIFVKDFSLSEIRASMEKNKDAISFSLLSGRNTHYCYAKSEEQGIPKFQEQGRILKFDWSKVEGDFGYPMNVAACVFRVNDIFPLLEMIPFDNPNMLEGHLAINAKIFLAALPDYPEDRSKRLCYEESVAFCDPINLVQDVTKNRVGGNGKYSSENLAQVLDLGWRIDVENYSGFVPNGATQEVELKLK